MRAWLAASALAVALLASCASADERPSKMWWLFRSELDAYGEYASSFTESGFTEIKDVKQMPYEDIVLLGFRMCVRDGAYRDLGDGRVSVADSDVSRSIKARTGVDLLDHRSVRVRGSRIDHERLNYIAPAGIGDAPCGARVDAVFKDGCELILTGEVTASDGTARDLYLHAAPSEGGELHVISLLCADRPEEHR